MIAKRARSTARGAALVITMIAIPLLLLIVYFVVNTVNIPVIKARVQAATDAAAHAGTLILDPNDPTSWERARVAAISVLAQYSAELGGFGDALTQSGTRLEDTGGRAVITVQRGRFAPGVDAGGMPSGGNFESLEDDYLTSHSLDYLQPIRGTLANAINIKIDLHAGALFAPSWDDGGVSLFGAAIAAESTVTFDQVEEWVPPFAIPLCSVLDGAGTFDPTQLCLSDRLFTTLEWQDKFGGVIPDFLYDPGNSTQVQVDQCYWDSPQYLDADNNYGVIGLPAATEHTVSAVAVQSVLDSVNPSPGLISAHLGQRFALLQPQPGEDIAPALATSIGARLWQLITNPAGVTSETWPRFSQGLEDLFGAPARIQPNWIPYPLVGTPSWDTKCNTPFDPSIFRPEQEKVCGSHRFTWKCNSAGAAEPSCETAALPPVNDTVWRVKVPLIAAVNTQGRVENCGAPAPLDPTKNWSIIGFVTVRIYDTDIGLARPQQSNLNVMMSPAGATLNCPGYSFAGTDHWVPRCDGSQPMYLTTTAADPPCNVVRARIDCNTAFEATKRAPDGTFSLRLVK